jgi:ribonucleoside-diphosphate reductase alpha chain
MGLKQLIKEGEAPEWMTSESLDTLSRGYLLDNETPRGMYKRVAKAAAKQYKDSKKLEKKFFDYMWKNWLCPASPVLSNMGTTRGLPISCFSTHVDDSVDSIFMKNHEFAMLSKHGGGVGIYLGNIRGRGAAINGNGKSEGMVPWCKTFDTTCSVVSQGGTRRGAGALYLPIEHSDVDEFMKIRRPIGDINRQCLNINHALTITDKWMNDLVNGNKHNRQVWENLLTTRVETGEPYLFFTDATNNQSPNCYKQNNLRVSTSNICTEITLYTDPDHTFVCCLSSLNLMKWDEWKDSDLVETTVMFLDGVMQEFIDRASNVKGFEAAVRSAIKGRALGIGVLGWHSLLQTKNLPFDSFDSMMLNASIFRSMREKADKQTAILAQELGEPEWCKGFNRRNTHCIAVAPTVSNSAISGGYSAGIEPMAANIFSLKSAKGTFIRKNKALEAILEEAGKNDTDTWTLINTNGGSISKLDFLNEDTKNVFLTAREINQHSVIKQAGQRQRWIDQAQSINLFFAAGSDPKYIHEVHLEAWKQGIKSLYYLRTEGVISGDSAFRSSTECSACEA